MKRRLAVWSLIGFLVACGWVLFIQVTAPPAASQGALWTIIQITAPASLLRHLPLKYYWFILLNASVYLVVGAAVELLRRNPLRRS